MVPNKGGHGGAGFGSARAECPISPIPNKGGYGGSPILPGQTPGPIGLKCPRPLGPVICFDIRAPFLQSPVMYLPYIPLRDDYGNATLDLCLYGSKDAAFFTVIDSLYDDLWRRVIAYAPTYAGFHRQPAIRDAHTEGSISYARRLKAHAFNMVAYDAERPDYTDEDYRCEKCNKRLTELNAGEAA